MNPRVRMEEEDEKERRGGRGEDTCPTFPRQAVLNVGTETKANGVTMTTRRSSKGGAGGRRGQTAEGGAPRTEQ